MKNPTNGVWDIIRRMPWWQKPLGVFLAGCMIFGLGTAFVVLYPFEKIWSYVASKEEKP